MEVRSQEGTPTRVHRAVWWRASLLSGHDAHRKNGLIEKTLEAEKLKAQLAKLRREKFDASSERIERTIEQFELALAEIEAATAETAAPTTSTNEAEVPDAPPVPAGPAASSRKKRPSCRPGCRAARSCMRRPACAKLAAAPSCARLEYIPRRFEVATSGPPARAASAR